MDGPDAPRTHARTRRLRSLAAGDQRIDNLGSRADARLQPRAASRTRRTRWSWTGAFGLMDRVDAPASYIRARARARASSSASHAHAPVAADHARMTAPGLPNQLDTLRLYSRTRTRTRTAFQHSALFRDRYHSGAWLHDQTGRALHAAHAYASFQSTFLTVRRIVGR
jgi:hypothetical protein